VTWYNRLVSERVQLSAEGQPVKRSLGDWCVRAASLGPSYLSCQLTRVLYRRLWQEDVSAGSPTFCTVHSRCQETASGDSNRQRTLVCHWTVKCSSEGCIHIQVVNKSNSCNPYSIYSHAPLNRDNINCRKIKRKPRCWLLHQQCFSFPSQFYYKTLYFIPSCHLGGGGWVPAFATALRNNYTHKHRTSNYNMVISRGCEVVTMKQLATRKLFADETLFLHVSESFPVIKALSVLKVLSMRMSLRPLSVIPYRPTKSNHRHSVVYTHCLLMTSKINFSHDFTVPRRELS
jgi:hypothetical protein